ncbi:MAG: aminotransferase class I/II-fold pyridoxal phosphate-dependent enzyme [Bacilli bacterium]
MFNEIKRYNTKSVKWDVATKKYGDDLVILSIADSEYETCPEVKEDLIKRASHGAFGYNYCDDEYYNVVCSWYKNSYNLKIAPEWILPSMGVVYSISLITKLVAKYRVLIQSPVYHHFFKIPNYSNLDLLVNKLVVYEDSYVIDYNDLEDKLKQSDVFILCNPQNPVGRVWKKEELEKIVLLCKKYNVFLISDEVHADIMLFNYKFYSVGHFFDVYDNIALVSAPSKTFNLAGLQIANIIIKNSIIRNQIKKSLADMLFRTPNIFGMTALISAYTVGYDYVRKQNKHIEDNFLLLKEYFNLHIKKAKVFNLQGTYLVWVDLGYTGLKSEEIVEGLAKFKVIVSDGATFTREECSFIRINIACPREFLIRGLNRINEFLINLP